MNSEFVDVVFSVRGQWIPCDHGYLLYSAVAKVAPSLHQSKDVGLFAIGGRNDDNNRLALVEASSLRIRLPYDRVREAIRLAGKTLDLGGHRIQVGVPRLQALAASARLFSRLVVMTPAKKTGESRRPSITPEWFLKCASRKLTELGITAAQPGIPLTLSGRHSGEPQRRILGIKGQVYAGYPLIIEGLNPEESITLQQAGMGGRRLMGCGLFLPKRG